MHAWEPVRFRKQGQAARCGAGEPQAAVAVLGVRAPVRRLSACSRDSAKSPDAPGPRGGPVAAHLASDNAGGRGRSIGQPSMRSPRLHATCTCGSRRLLALRAGRRRSRHPRGLRAVEDRTARRPDPALLGTGILFNDNGEAACDLVCELGPAAVPQLPKLIAALSEDYWDLQWAAADALRAVASADASVLASLIESLAHPSFIVRSSSARALAAIGQPAVDRLRQVIARPGDSRGPNAAYALSELGPDAGPALPALRSAMRADDNEALAR
jgi:hypothetical protein